MTDSPEKKIKNKKCANFGRKSTFFSIINLCKKVLNPREDYNAIQLSMLLETSISFEDIAKDDPDLTQVILPSDITKQNKRRCFMNYIREV